MTPLCGGLKSASESAQGGMTTSRPSYKEPSVLRAPWSVKDGEGVSRKRRRGDSDASKYEGPPKDPEADSMVHRIWRFVRFIRRRRINLTNRHPVRGERSTGQCPVVSSTGGVVIPRLNTDFYLRVDMGRGV